MKTDELAKWIREEHQAVHDLMDDLKDLVASSPRTNQAMWIEQVTKSFEHIRAHMNKHFALEEHEGYMLAVVERRPAMSREVDRLGHEHNELRRLMNHIYDILKDLKPEDALLIRDMCHRINDFIEYMEHHQNEENLLVLSVYTDDIGTKD